MPRTVYLAVGILVLMTTILVSPALGGSDNNAVAFPMYATGEIGCEGAEDTTNKAGMAILRPVDSGIDYHIVLTSVEPDWDYYIELQVETTECLYVAGGIRGFTSDKNGHVTFDGVFELEPGTYMVNIDVVSDPSWPGPPKFENREIGGFGFVEITVPEM